MRKVLLTFMVLFFVLSAQAVDTTQPKFARMTKLWCTVDYKHWAPNYADKVSFTEKNFYLYLDLLNKKVYDEQKQPVTKVVSFADKEIKFENVTHNDKRTYSVSYTLDRYTGRAKGKGTVRHDYGGWASMTYDNRNFVAKGYCGKVDDLRNF